LTQERVGDSIGLKRAGEILEETLLSAGILIEYQSNSVGPRVEAPGAEVFTVLEKDGVASRAMRAVGYGNWHVG
jgi:hypothetical protein